MAIKQTLVLVALSWFACGGAHTVMEKKATKGGLPQKERVVKSDAEWKRILTPEQYYILRQQGTERAFTGKYHDHHERGIYVCAACRLPLFASAAKFDSGTGWPSFFAPVSVTHVEELEDRSHGMVRTEVRCGRCGGHLGHVFGDGPRGPLGSGADRRSSLPTSDGPRGPLGSGADRRSSSRTSDGPRGPLGFAADTRSSRQQTDGPRPTGLRYCINSAALQFIKQ